MLIRESKAKMVMFKTSLALLSLMSMSLITIFSMVHAQDTPEDFVQAHNAARAQVGVGTVIWDDTVAAYAQDYANKRAGDCGLVHSGGPYGENIAMSSGDLSGTEAVKLWVDEKPYYDYDSNCCTNGQQCLHYTQVVWNNSFSVGCGKVRCSNGGTFITCNYEPYGNIIGERPY